MIHPTKHEIDAFRRWYKRRGSRFLAGPSRVGLVRSSGLPTRYPAGSILGVRVEDRSGWWIGLILAVVFFGAAARWLW